MKDMENAVTSILSDKMKTDILNNQLTKDLFNVLIGEEEADPCDYCKHNVVVCSESCIDYQEGRGATDKNGRYLDWHWSCMDWEFGSCKRLEHTPCHNCCTKDKKFVNWEYKHKVKKENSNETE